VSNQGVAHLSSAFGASAPRSRRRRIGDASSLGALANTGASALRLGCQLALLPILPILYMTAAIIRAISDMDEMKRKIVTEAMAFSGLATGFTCFSYLFFRDMGAPEFRPEWAFYVMWAYYGIGLFFSWRRYR